MWKNSNNRNKSILSKTGDNKFLVAHFKLMDMALEQWL